MDLGRLGVWCFNDRLSPQELSELAQTTERLGYSALWYVEAVSYESIALGSFLLNQTEKLIIAPGIANIYARDATATKQAQNSLDRFSGGRFLLGLGISHAFLVENVRGHSYGKPVTTMRKYLDAMDKAAEFAPSVAAPPPTVLAALGPNMTKLAAERTAGALPYNVTPEHTSWARGLMGPGSWLCVEQKILRVTDATKAREVARQAIAPYMGAPNYRKNWIRLGFSEADLADGGSNRFLDAMVAWGDDAAIQQRIQQHWDAGADHVCIQPLHAERQPWPDLDALEAFAPTP